MENKPLETKLFYDFCLQLLGFLKSGYTLQEGLEIVSQSNIGGNKLKQFCNYVLSELENGSPLSNILMANPYITVNKKYQQLVASEEKIGTYKKSLAFICKTEKEQRETIQEYLKLSAYPFFIILLCFFGTLFFAHYSQTLIIHATTESIFKSLIYANSFLLCFIFLFCFALYLNHRKSEKLIFLICLDFFLGNTYDLATALENVCVLFSDKTKMKFALGKTITSLRLGISTSQSFSDSHLFNKNEIAKLEPYVLSGKLYDGIKILLKDLNQKDKNNKQIFASFVEPCFIFAAGIYLLIIVVQAILPILISYGGIL